MRGCACTGVALLLLLLIVLPLDAAGMQRRAPESAVFSAALPAPARSWDAPECWKNAPKVD